MQYLAKLLTAIKQDSKLFQNPEVNYILGLTTTQVKELKKATISEGLIEEHKREFTLTKAGDQYINEAPIISWVDEINNKRPEINLEYLKIEKTPPTLTRATRLLARHLLEGEELKENSTEHYLVRELLCSRSTCAKIKKEIEKFVLQNNRFKLTCLFERFMTPPYGLTKSIVSILLLDVLAMNKDILAIYENSQFQLKLTSLMFNKSRVPKDWSDNDVADFKIKVKELALKFTTIEATAGVKNIKSDGTLIKLLNQISMLSKPQKMVLVREIVGGN